MKRTRAIALVVAAFLLAACAADPTPLPELPAPALATAPPATEAMPDPTEAVAEATATEEAMPEPTATVEAAAAEPTTAPVLTGVFVKEEVSVTGSYTLDPASGELNFSDDFGVIIGPDLYVILSGASDLTVDYQTFSGMVLNAPLLNLGALIKTTGAQTYHVPEGTDFSEYKTVVVWCQGFSVAFAAAPLTQ